MTIPLGDAVSEGKILLDLASRIMGSFIKLPPLRERKEDISDFIEIFFARKGKKLSKDQIEELANACKGYYWQGNIRMLFQAFKVLIMEADLAEEPYSSKFLPDFNLMREPGLNTADTKDFEKIVKKVLSGVLKYSEAISTLDKMILEKTIESTSNITEALAKLDISRSTLDSRRKKYHI